MINCLESLLIKRYGEPEEAASKNLIEHRWHNDDEDLRCILYKATSADNDALKVDGPLKDLYFDALGGFLVGSSLKIATVGRPRVFGLWTISELEDQRAVHTAKRLDQGVHYFMDAANVWFYGIKNEELMFLIQRQMNSIVLEPWNSR